jgi:hypothetical protein
VTGRDLKSNLRGLGGKIFPIPHRLSLGSRQARISTGDLAGVAIRGMREDTPAANQSSVIPIAVANFSGSPGRDRGHTEFSRFQGLNQPVVSKLDNKRIQFSYG